MTIFVTNYSSFAKRGQAVSWLNVSSAAVTASSSAWPSDHSAARTVSAIWPLRLAPTMAEVTSGRLARATANCETVCPWLGDLLELLNQLQERFEFGQVEQGGYQVIRLCRRQSFSGRLSIHRG